MNEVNELHHTYTHKNFFIRYFARLKVLTAIRMSNLKEKDLVLDFGCGSGWLKNNLRERGFNVMGYDIVKEQSDLSDYTIIKPNKIFALDVFEHIPEEDIRKIIKNFKNMNPNLELITIIPTENFISRKARKLLGKSERVKGHITPLKKILEILNEELSLVKKINLLTVSYIAKFKNN